MSDPTPRSEVSLSEFCWRRGMPICHSVSIDMNRQGKKGHRSQPYSAKYFVTRITNLPPSQESRYIPMYTVGLIMLHFLHDLRQIRYGKKTCYGNGIREQPYISYWDLHFPNEAGPCLVKPSSQPLSQMGIPRSPITKTLDNSHHGSKAKQWKNFR